jgi:hypothetical protein
MPESTQEYYAYLLRMWRTGSDGPWRASLEDAQTGERVGFSSLAEACSYLRARAGEAAWVQGGTEPTTSQDAARASTPDDRHIPKVRKGDRR